jgi:hypothetical protein
MLVGAPAAIGELDRVGLAEDDHALSDQAARDRGGGRRAPRPVGGGAAHGSASREVDQVLEHHGHAVQGPDGVAGADRAVGALGGKPGIVGIDLRERLQLGLVRGDAREMSLDRLDGGEPPRGDLAGEIARRQESGIQGVIHV